MEKRPKAAWWEWEGECLLKLHARLKFEQMLLNEAKQSLSTTTATTTTTSCWNKRRPIVAETRVQLSSYHKLTRDRLRQWGICGSKYGGRQRGANKATDKQANSNLHAGNSWQMALSGHNAFAAGVDSSATTHPPPLLLLLPASLGDTCLCQLSLCIRRSSLIKLNF